MEKIKTSNCREVNVDELLNTLKEESSTKGTKVCVDKMFLVDSITVIESFRKLINTLRKECVYQNESKMEVIEEKDEIVKSFAHYKEEQIKMNKELNYNLNEKVKEVNVLNDLLECKNESIEKMSMELTKVSNENFNLKVKIEKLEKEKSKLNKELQALTEIHNECKREYDDLKRLENKSKTLCDDCELQHKECHCDCAREFIPKDKEKEFDKLFKQYKEHGYCLYGFTDLEDLIRFIIL